SDVKWFTVYDTALRWSVQRNEQFISVKTGENATLSCKVEKSDTHVKVWYKQQLWQKPKEVVSKLDQKPPVIKNGSKFSVNEDFSLTIKETSEDDEGMYFCGKTDGKTFTFSNIITSLLYSPGHPQVNISVLQTPVRGSVSPGESVTLQCTVLSEIRAADLRSDISVLQTSVRGSVSPGESVTLQCTVMSEIRAADVQVLWFRAAAGQSFPEIIYTHQNSSSRQCEINSSTSCSLYEFSKNILDQRHTGTYYCAVAVCGKIIFGNGTSVELSKSFCALLGTCVADMIILSIFYLHLVSVQRQMTTEQNSENLHYAAIHIKEKKAKSARVKREQPKDIVYSQVRSSKAAAHRSHH
uniref:Ig-like domain-containing protein n=1 Tax=Pygocentrus nattereri TaxID=42514 RepID=A0A3B4E9I4_PYGNA